MKKDLQLVNGIQKIWLAKFRNMIRTKKSVSSNLLRLLMILLQNNGMKAILINKWLNKKMWSTNWRTNWRLIKTLKLLKIRNLTQWTRILIKAKNQLQHQMLQHQMIKFPHKKLTKHLNQKLKLFWILQRKKHKIQIWMLIKKN